MEQELIAKVAAAYADQPEQPYHIFVSPSGNVVLLADPGKEQPEEDRVGVAEIGNLKEAATPREIRGAFSWAPEGLNEE